MKYEEVSRIRRIAENTPILRDILGAMDWWEMRQMEHGKPPEWLVDNYEDKDIVFVKFDHDEGWKKRVIKGDQ